ncbi:MAG: flagellar export protein FliJ [Pseudomonadota bacterium]
MDPSRFDPLIQIAETRVEEAAGAYAQVNGQLALHENRLGDLRRFASEYHGIPNGGTSAVQLVNRRAFAARVDDVARQQAQHVDHARRAAEKQREALVEARREAEALRRLAAVRRAEANRRIERRSQSELEDLAVRGFIARHREDP